MAKRNGVCARLVVVDRDARYGEWLRHHLGVICPDARIRLLNLSEFERWSEEVPGRDCDVLMLAASFGSSPEDPEAQGLELLRKLREHPHFPAVIAVAEEGNELTAVRALQLGAVDYLPKRLLTPERLRTSVRLALRRIEKRVARRIASLAQEADSSPAQASASKAPDAAAREGSADPAAVAGQEAAARPAGAAAAATAPGGEFMPADFIPGYTIHATLGESEKAAVYVATSAARGHNVALKVSKTLRDDAAGRQFLEREYTAIAAIRNPSVVEIYDYGVHTGYEYLVMEYLPQGDLKARMQKGLTEPEALRYVEQIAAALQVVHQAGLLHRDLKPPNVMLRENGDVALIDFGLARALDGSTPSTRTGVLRGSPYYMSPEQALGEQLDARSDFYSLGIMYYEMLTGRKPYTGGSAMDVLQQHVNAPVPQLSKALAHNEPLLAKLLAKSREERFTSATELLAAIATAREIAQVQSSAA
ncbi:MAG: protein kinase domain-containing protein [Steroidobacteraceae bacterium]